MKAIQKHKLIIFYGSCPGAGKSTLSSFLYEQLQLNDIHVKWMYEDDVLHFEEFQEFVSDIQSGNHKLIESLLEASSKFIEQRKECSGIWITDSIFPCFNWLIATDFYNHEQIFQFGRKLEQILRPLNPLIIYLNVDQKHALRRAVQQRGQKWLEDMRVGLNNYGYNREKPLQNFDDVAAYFKMTGDLSLKWLMDWESDLLVLDAKNNNVLDLKKIILKQLELHVITPPKQIDLNSLAMLIGSFECNSNELTVEKQLVFKIVNGVLRVNLYWPNGCDLIADGHNTFRLKDTSHQIRFEQFRDRIPQKVTHDHKGQSHQYFRTA